MAEVSKVERGEQDIVSGMKLPFLMKGASRRYRINCVSAPASQKTGDKKLKHSERGITASKKPHLQVWRWHRKKWGSWRDVFAFGVGRDESRAKAGALLPCEKPPDFFFTPAQVAAPAPQGQQPLQAT